MIVGQVLLQLLLCADGGVGGCYVIGDQEQLDEAQEQIDRRLAAHRHGHKPQEHLKKVRQKNAVAISFAPLHIFGEK